MGCNTQSQLEQWVQSRTGMDGFGHKQAFGVHNGRADG